MSVLLTGLLLLGYYSGQGILYPYDPIYCTEENGGACYGAYMYIPKSAPLPPIEKWCRWADIEGEPNKNWYQWKPRIVAIEQQKFLGERICYLEDKGEPHNINELPKD